MYLITPTFSGILGAIVFIAWVILAFIALLNIFRTPWLNATSRLVWIVIIIVVPVLGALVYLFWKKVKKVNS